MKYRAEIVVVIHDEESMTVATTAEMRFYFSSGDPRELLARRALEHAAADAADAERWMWGQGAA